jgi:uncharacterized repeat protein (TIGR01451 family)
MKKIFIVQILLAFCLGLNAQTYVNIPDANFVNWLNQNYPACMNGSQMDITCPAIQSAFSVNVQQYNITDLTGIEHFTSLLILNCSFNQLSFLPSLPPYLINLNCLSNNLSSLPPLPSTLLTLNCTSNPLLTTFDPWPPSLETLSIGGAGTSLNIATIPPFPSTLKFLSVQSSQLTQLPPLPLNLETLFCGNNPLGNLPPLPSSIKTLACNNNNLDSLPNPLPAGLRSITFDNNNITYLPALPNTMQQIMCSGNNLTQFPSLPDSIHTIVANNCQLTSLPNIPALMTYLEVNNNQLTSLPPLNNLINNLRCANNQLTSLPPLPNSMLVLNVTNNQITCWHPFPSTIASPGIGNNPFTCLPNYIPSMGVMGLLSYPLCEDGDLINNPYGCTSANGVSGNVFNDIDSDCLQSANETGLHNIPLHLLDAQMNLVSSTISSNDGIYFLSTDTVVYTVIVDTLNKPYRVVCNHPGADSTIQFTPSYTLAQNVNFALECKPGFDIGVQSITPNGWVFPGQVHTLRIAAGDMSNWYGLSCAGSVSGSVVVTVNGPVAFQGVPAGALNPVVSGVNQFTYNISDFSGVNFNNDFRLLFSTDTTAQAGDIICVNVIMNPISGDNDISNNNFSHCYHVINSYDPNIKTVWPLNVEPGFNDYFTYTIFFQNTGNAPAFNIRIADTLDALLNLNTFEVMNYSHNCQSYLNGNILTFRFNNIMLPDSTSDPEGSIGYVQYRIKPMDGLPAGTVIHNTAHIFFDFNPAIVTNTTENEFMLMTGDSPFSQTLESHIYPNPVNDLLHIRINAQSSVVSTVEVFSIQGERVFSKMVNQPETTFDTSELAKGMYIICIRNQHGVSQKRFIKQ